MHKCFAPSKELSFKERRLAYGVRFVDALPPAEGSGPKSPEAPKEKGRDPKAVQEERRELKAKRDARESEDRKGADRDLQAIESKMDAATSPKEAQEQLRSEWLRNIEKELKLAEGSLKLGQPNEVVRSPCEQHGVYLNGKIVGNIAAGFEAGRYVKDASKYEDTVSGPSFLEKGFRAQVFDLVQ